MIANLASSITVIAMNATVATLDNVSNYRIMYFMLSISLTVKEKLL